MASGTIYTDSKITSAGTYSLGRTVAPAYTTASGNYFLFFLPIHLSPNLTITDVSCAEGTVFITGTRINDTSFGTPLLSSATITNYGVALECRFASTQAKNTGGAFSASDVTITVS